MGWEDKTADWTAGIGSWDGSKWVSGDFGGYQFLTLTPGAWASGYLPDSMRLTFSVASINIVIMTSLQGAVQLTVSSGEIVGFSAYGEIQFIQFGGLEASFNVTKLEFNAATSHAFYPACVIDLIDADPGWQPEPEVEPRGRWISDITRTPVALVILTIDACSRSFGVSPCTATGEACYNTYASCKDKPNFDRTTIDYKFTSIDAALPFAGPRPYVKDIRYMPTEIKDSLTVNARVTVSLADEPDGDVGLDPYWDQRAEIQGTYWKKWIARNRNFKGRPMRIFEGYLGLEESEFAERWHGVVEDIKADKAAVKIEGIDMLKNLSKIQVPASLNIKLIQSILAATTPITLNTVTGLDSPAGHVWIGEEVISYAGVDTGTNQITGCTRGAFSTTAAAHNANEKVQMIRVYGPANPFDILLEMLRTDAAMPEADIDAAAFELYRDWPGGEIDFYCLVTEPTKLDKLYFEIVDLLDCRSWVAETLKITIRRMLPVRPDVVFWPVTDEANIIENSCGVDYNDAKRITRMLVYWDKNALGKPDEVNSYNRMAVVVDADAESENEYGEVQEKKVFCRWLRLGAATEEEMEAFISGFAKRRVWRERDALPIVSLEVERKDSEIKTGDIVHLSTDEILEQDGSAIETVKYQVVKREEKSTGRIALKLQKLVPTRAFIITPAGFPDYASATAAQREYGFITEADGRMPNGDDGYYIY